MVASLARPGGNITGLTNQAAELPSKRIELLRQLFPDLRRFAVIANVSYAGAAAGGPRGSGRSPQGWN